MEDFNVEHLEEVELDQFEDDTSTPHSPINNLKLIEKKI